MDTRLRSWARTGDYVEDPDLDRRYDDPRRGNEAPGWKMPDWLFWSPSALSLAPCSPGRSCCAC